MPGVRVMAGRATGDSDDDGEAEVGTGPVGGLGVDAAHPARSSAQASAAAYREPMTDDRTRADDAEYVAERLAILAEALAVADGHMA